MSHERLSETEWSVLHAAQDAARGGRATFGLIAGLLPDLPRATVKRTASRLASWGLIRTDGSRLACEARPDRPDPTTPAPALPGKTPEIRRLPLYNGDVLDTIGSVDAATPEAACREILRVIHEFGVAI